MYMWPCTCSYLDIGLWFSASEFSWTSFIYISWTDTTFIPNTNYVIVAPSSPILNFTKALLECSEIKCECSAVFITKWLGTAISSYLVLVWDRCSVSWCQFWLQMVLKRKDKQTLGRHRACSLLFLCDTRCCVLSPGPELQEQWEQIHTVHADIFTS